ncbi:MAG: hypothetical protein HY827_06050 [Actinobacteria bacterium]|nr:hypothetical protein [Actinomycetota bacterium]
MNPGAVNGGVGASGAGSPGAGSNGPGVTSAAQFTAITPREASIFTSAVDALLAPAPDLPATADTSAAAGFDDWMARSPAINRAAVRAGLYILEISPRLGRRGCRFRQLDRDARREFLSPSDKRRPIWIAALVDTLRMLAAAVYYGDDDVARALGYDADARVARGRELRSTEGRP